MWYQSAKSEILDSSFKFTFWSLPNHLTDSYTKNCLLTQESSMIPFFSVINIHTSHCIESSFFQTINVSLFIKKKKRRFHFMITLLLPVLLFVLLSFYKLVWCNAALLLLLIISIRMETIYNDIDKMMSVRVQCW